jgi:cell pole-organizing protein PopZ
MLSVEAQRETGNAFNRLAQVLLNRSGDGQSLEDMTQNLLRGMLKQWLDANLPGVVERLVREEIERVARRGR